MVAVEVLVAVMIRVPKMTMKFRQSQLLLLLLLLLRRQRLQ